MNSTKRVAFLTLGCKVNQYETESIKKQFLDRNYIEEEFNKEADIYIVNSCTVTNVADRKTRKYLRRAKKINPNAIVVATGCYAQTNAKDIEKIKEVDIIIGNTKKFMIVDIVEEKIKKKDHVDDIMKKMDYQELDFSTLREMSRAYIKIQDGCNNFCSYCKIPYARGPQRSREMENIIIEVKNLAKEGYKEIILIGINLGAYGEDLDIEFTLEDVLDQVSLVNGIERIRIGSIYPDKISKRLVEILKNNEKMMPHLHISLQSGSDKILNLMNRKYIRSEALEILKKLKKEIKDMSLTADLIVGFPGEGEEEFLETYDFVEEMLFSDLHIFQYSERENTKAANFKDKVRVEDKKSRMESLEKLREKLSIEFRKRYIGKELEVLIEENEGSLAKGYSKNYLRVGIKTKEFSENTTVKGIVMSMEKELLLIGS